MRHDPTQNFTKIPFDCDSFAIDGSKVSFLDSGGSKPSLHFYHANGFPLSVYMPMLVRLTACYRVLGLGLRGQDAQTMGNTSWYNIAQDLIHFLDSQQYGPVLGVGHSVGAVATMMAAVERPDLFSRIILIDPVILPYKAIIGRALKHLLGNKTKFPLAQRARARKHRWANREELYQYLQTKSLFSRFDDEYLRSYVTYGAKPSADGGIELLCPPEAEARIFENYPFDIWSWIQRLKVPALIIRGEYSDILSERTVAQICNKAVNASSLIIKGTGHLIPMEKPDDLLTVINSFSEKC